MWDGFDVVCVRERVCSTACELWVTLQKACSQRGRMPIWFTNTQKMNENEMLQRD